MEAYRHDKKWGQLAKWSNELGIPSWSSSVVRMASIHPNLLMGSRLSAQSIIDGCAIKDQDETEHRDNKHFHILCVARSKTCSFCDHSSRFHSVVIRDRDIGSNPEMMDNAKVAADLLHTLLSKKKIVLVHCHSGRNRSALVILVYCARYTSLTFDASLFRIKRYNGRRFSEKHTLSNTSFVRCVRRNWDELRQGSTDSIAEQNSIPTL